MSKGWKYKSGDWNVICDVCGKKMKSSHAKHRWDGFIVCSADFEERHPQDFVKAKSDKISVPWTRPIVPESFVNITYTIPRECTKMGKTAMPAFAIAGCSISGDRF